MLRANSLGTHRLLLLVVGKQKNPLTNLSPLTEPIDQGVNPSFKRNYRKLLFRYLSLPDDDALETVANFCRKISLKDSCHTAADCWESVKQITLRNFCWTLVSTVDSTDNDADKEMEEIMGTLDATFVRNECDKPDVDKRQPFFDSLLDSTR
ncbi:hypothetical protein M513_06294 [Trichuris suis]|uniref:DDE-1 domain-containing protein n=1 Tax=Trichuris suis TaxID=68888 RepID=A0A085M6F7_9BILA|nr:hypothetical protein M513_06294 [Trichuris suis]